MYRYVITFVFSVGVCAAWFAAFPDLRTWFGMIPAVLLGVLLIALVSRGWLWWRGRR